MISNSRRRASQNFEFSTDDSIKILLLSFSPRLNHHTDQLIKQAGQALGEIPNLQLQFETLADKKILGCQQCLDRCRQAGHCWLEDDFENLVEQWLQADAIILGSPVYTFRPPATALAFFERWQALQSANPSRYFSPAWPQPVGVLSQGGSEYGGVEICAQALHSLCRSVGCIPVSGDMPGFSQGVIGQFPNGDQAPERLAVGAGRLAIRTAELGRLLSTGRNYETAPLKFLIAKAGEFSGSKVASQIETALTDITETDAGALTWEVFDFEENPIARCLGCNQLCSRALECRFIDGMQDFRSRWFSTDAIFWLIGCGAGGTISNLLAAIDRMNQVRFETHFASGNLHMPRHLTAAAGIFWGEDPEKFGELWQLIGHVSTLYQNLLVPVSKDGPNVVWVGREADSGQILKEETLAQVSSLVQQTARLAQIVRTGKSHLGKLLPAEYFPLQADPC